MASTIITKNSSTASATPAVGDLQQGELAVNVTDKKVYTKDSSAAIVKLVGSLGNQEASAVAITGGSIAGITDLAVADGGTGSSTAAGARSNLGAAASGANSDITSLSGLTTALSVAQGGTGVTTSTGTGSVVLSNSPTLVTPALGTPSAAVLTNATGLPLSTGISGLGTGVATFLGTPSSANLLAAVTDETGTGALVFANSPTLVTPALGTPASATLTNATGLPISTGVSGLGTGVATALAVNVGSAGAPVVNGGVLGTPSSATLTNATGLPISTGVSGLGTGVATALAVNVGSAGAPVVNGGALGTPSSGTVTNLTGTASININGTVGATTPTTGAFTTLSASGAFSANGGATLGDASGDALTINSSAVSIPNGLNFDSNTFVIDATNNRVGVGVASPAQALSVLGNIFGRTSSASNTNSDFRLLAGAYTGNAGTIVTYNGTSGSNEINYGGGTGQGEPATTHIFLTGTAGSLGSGTERMRITSAGNVGIGTSSPQRKIHGYVTTGPVARFQTVGSNAATEYVPGATDGTGTIYNWVIGAQYNIGNAFEITPSTAAGGLTFSNPAFVVTSGGNVGIGTSSPAVKLDVQGTQNGISNPANGVANIVDTTAAAQGVGGQIVFKGQYQSGSYTQYGAITAYKESATVDGSQYGASLIFNTRTQGGNNTEKMRLDSSGNLGLGTAPSAWSGYTALQVNNAISLWTSSGSSVYLSNNVYTDGVGRKYVFNGYASEYQTGGGAHYWKTAASGTAGNAISFTTAMTLDASGRLLVGRTSSDANGYFLQLNGTSGSQAGMLMTYAGVGSAAIWENSSGALVFGNDGASGQTERARIDSSGNLLVGTTTLNGAGGFSLSPSATAPELMVKGSATTNTSTTYELYSTGASAYRFYVGFGGTIYATSTTITAISDQRLKENIQDLDVGLDKIMALKPRKFDWKEGKGKNKKGDRGWIAQEFEQVFPDMIDTWADPAPEGEEPYKAVNADLIPVLVKALQEAHGLIKSLEARVVALEAK